MCGTVWVILYIEPADRERYRDFLEQFFRLRKKVFCDQHGWVKANPDGTETDHLDDAYNIVILYINGETNLVTGGVRLMPTTGDTLMHTAWVDMLPSPDDFRSPNIWEATRFCVDETSNAFRNRSFVNHATLALMLATLDFAGENGISSIIAVCENKIFGMCESFGGKPEIISTKTEIDGCEISCGLWSTDESLRQTLKWARPFLGGAEPVKIKAA